MENVKAITKDSFQITGRGIILEINHNLQGLPKGTILKSKVNNLNWEVISRVIFHHPEFKQIHFEIETQDYMRITFDTNEKLLKSVEQIFQKEKDNIYQYLIKPLDHNQKPNNEEYLEIKLPITQV